VEIGIGELCDVVRPVTGVVVRVMDAARQAGAHKEYEWRGDGQPLAAVINEHLDHAARHLLPLCREGYQAGDAAQQVDVEHALVRLALAVAARDARQGQ